MIDIIIATKFRPARAEETIRKFLEKSIRPDTGFIISTDYDDEQSSSHLKNIQSEFPDRISVIVNPFKGSNVASFNAGAKLSKKKYVGYFADDCIINYDGWDEKTLELFSQNPTYECLNIRTHNPEGRNIYQGIEYPFCFIIDRKLFKKIGFFNEQYLRYAADPDFGMTLVINEILMMTSKDMLLHHFEEQDSLWHHNNAIVPFDRDNSLLHRTWGPKLPELQKKYAKIKHLWGKLV